MTVLLSNTWLAFFFGISMQPLFDMINCLQITALLGFFDVTFPSNAMDLFKVLVTIVSFDFFDFYDTFNPGFTPTEPYSSKFDWFGFGSINFMEGLGFFLTLLIVMLLFQATIAILAYALTYKMQRFFSNQVLVNTVSHAFKKNSWFSNKFDPVVVFQAGVRFMMEAYIELVMVCSISFKMFEIRPIWNNWDKLAVGLHFVGIICSASFFLFVCWFALIKVRPLSTKKYLERKEKNKEVINDVATN